MSFATDVAFAMVPGGSAVSAGAKAAVKAIAKTGFKQMVKTGAVRSTAKTMIRKVFANPLIQQELRHIAMKAALKAMMAMNAASRTGAMMDAAACRKVTTMAMAAMTITAREMGENLLRLFIIRSPYEREAG